MKNINSKFPPENRNIKDYFDSPTTEDLLALQEEKAKQIGIYPPKINFIEDIDGFSDQKDQLCFGEII